MLVEHLLRSSRSGPPLRVALLVDGLTLPRTFAHVVDHIQRSDFARVALVVVREPPPAAGTAPAPRRAGRRADPADPSRLLFELYDRWDRRRTQAALAGAIGPVDLSDRLRGIPALHVTPVPEGAAERFPPDAVERLRAHDIDVALRFGFAPLRGDVLRAARHGIWSYHLGDDEYYRGGPAYFWELAERTGVSGVVLQASNGGSDGGVVLCKGLATTAGEYSLSRNRVKPSLLGSTFVIRKLKALHEEGAAALLRDATAPAPYKGRRDPYRTPSGWDMARFMVPVLLRKARERVVGPRLVHWHVEVRVKGEPAIAPGRPFERRGFRPVEAPRGRAWADPFLLRRGGQLYCFFEEFEHARRKGRICCAAVDGEGRFRDVRPVLDRPGHLSYPFVFEDGGDVFMIPESSQDGTVDLYRAVEFPGRWEKARTLLAGPGLDATLLRRGGRYWLFVAVSEPRGAGEQLLLFQADSLDGALRFHPRNPICTDVRCSRPAGAILAEGGRLVRPGQDGSVTYGHGVRFAEIVSLTPDDYREAPLTDLSPWPGVEGVHTYNRCGDVEVIDAKRMEPAARHLP